MPGSKKGSYDLINHEGADAEIAADMIKPLEGAFLLVKDKESTPIASEQQTKNMSSDDVKQPIQMPEPVELKITAELSGPVPQPEPTEDLKQCEENTYPFPAPEPQAVTLQPVEPETVVLKEAEQPNETQPVEPECVVLKEATQPKETLQSSGDEATEKPKEPKDSSVMSKPPRKPKPGPRTMVKSESTHCDKDQLSNDEEAKAVELSEKPEEQPLAEKSDDTTGANEPKPAPENQPPPKKTSTPKVKKPRQLTFTTSTPSVSAKAPSDLIAYLRRVLGANNCEVQNGRSEFVLLCRHSDDATQEEPLEFEAEVCRFLLKAGTNGIKFKQVQSGKEKEKKSEKKCKENKEFFTKLHQDLQEFL